MAHTTGTFLGLASLFAWIQASESLLLSRDVAVHNGSFAACAAFAIALLLYALINRLIAFDFGGKAVVACTAIAALCGLCYAFCPNDKARLFSFCLQAVAIAPFMIVWGGRLSFYSHRLLFPFVLGAGACAMALSLPLALLPIGISSLAIAALPVCSGLCLLATSAAKAPLPPSLDGKAPQLRATRTACNGFFTYEPIEADALRRMPWMLLSLLCLCTLSASLFNGLSMNPYVSNSNTVALVAFITAFVFLLAAGIGSIAVFRLAEARRTDGAPQGDDAAQGDAPQGGALAQKGDALSQTPQGSALQTPQKKGSPEGSAEERTGDDRGLLLSQLIMALLLILLVSGLLMLSMQLPGTMTLAFGLILGARNCLVLLGWVVFPRSVADARLPFVPCFALLVLASGTLYAQCLGVWVGKTINIAFDELIGAATVLIALIAVLAILYMVGRMRQTASQRSDESASAPAPSEPLTLEEIRSALRDYRLKSMEPYGLTEREQQIIALIIDGQTLGGIAEQLFISERTVKFHSKNAYNKLGVRNKKEFMQKFSDL